MKKEARVNLPSNKKAIAVIGSFPELLGFVIIVAGLFLFFSSQEGNGLIAVGFGVLVLGMSGRIIPLRFAGILGFVFLLLGLIFGVLG